MPILQARPGAQTPKDQSYPDVRGGSWGELGTSDMSGFFAEQVARGNGYVFSSALAGVVPIVATTTNNKMLLYNPPTSGRVFLVQRVAFGRTAVAATPLEGSIVYNRAQNIQTASTAAGTGNDIVSYTKADGVNLRGDIVGDGSGLFFAPAASVLTAAPTLWAASGVAQTADDAITSAQGPCVQYLVDWVWGLLQLWPGTLMSVGSAAAIATAYTVSIYGLSLPKPDFA